MIEFKDRLNFRIMNKREPLVSKNRSVFFLMRCIGEKITIQLGTSYETENFPLLLFLFPGKEPIRN